MRNLITYVALLVLSGCAWLSGEQPKRNASPMAALPASLYHSNNNTEGLQLRVKDDILTVTAQAPYTQQHAFLKAQQHCLPSTGYLPVLLTQQPTNDQRAMLFYYACAGDAVTRFRENVRAEEQFAKENPHLHKMMKELR